MFTFLDFVMLPGTCFNIKILQTFSDERSWRGQYELGLFYSILWMAESVLGHSHLKPKSRPIVQVASALSDQNIDGIRPVNSQWKQDL